MKKKLKHVLTGRIKNDPIESWFSLIRHLSGNHLVLDEPTFAYTEQILLLTLVSQLCTNVDGSHNKVLHTSFFDDVHSTIESTEKVEVNIKKYIWLELSTLCLKDSLINKILINQITPFIFGYGLEKILKRAPITCACYKNKLIYGIYIGVIKIIK